MFLHRHGYDVGKLSYRKTMAILRELTEQEDVKKRWAREYLEQNGLE